MPRGWRTWIACFEMETSNLILSIQVDISISDSSSQRVAELRSLQRLQTIIFPFGSTSVDLNFFSALRCVSWANKKHFSLAEQRNLHIYLGSITWRITVVLETEHLCWFLSLSTSAEVCLLLINPNVEFIGCSDAFWASARAKAQRECWQI